MHRWDAGLLRHIAARFHILHGGWEADGMGIGQKVGIGAGIFSLSCV